MSNIGIKFKRLRKEAILPSYAHSGDAGLDFYSCDNYIIKPGSRVIVNTGWSIELPKGYVSLIWDKSGLAAKRGLTVLGGVIEYTYRGEYGVILLNTSDETQEIKLGEKVAQLLIQPICTVDIEEVNELSETSRGIGGFGSTGNK